MLGKKESYKPRTSLDGVGEQTPYYTRKDFLDCYFPEEWEIAREAKINPFKDVLVFKRMVKFLGALPINLKRNMWESEDLLDNPINWDRPPKNEDGAWHAKIRLIDLDREEFIKTLQSIPTFRKLSERESPRKFLIINVEEIFTVPGDGVGIKPDGVTSPANNDYYLRLAVEVLILYQAYGNLYAMTECRDGVAIIKRRGQDLHRDAVRDLVTASGRG
nr:hypothetical protein [Tanacetum cinerariifolium]